MRDSFKFVFSIIIAPSCLLSVGCAAKKSAHYPSGSAGSHVGATSPVVSPLTVTVANPSRLKSFSALGILQPSLATSVSDRSVTSAGLQEVLTRRADEALSLKVVSVGPAGKGADALLKTDVLTYKERQGSAIGGDPATVAFNMSVIRMSDGVELWKAQYFYRQEALSDNWLKIGQRFGSEGTGAGWLSARELFERGIASALADLARRRDEQFMTSRERL